MAHGTKSKRESTKDAILTLLAGAENSQMESHALEERLKEMHCSKATIHRAREELKRSGKIVKTAVGNGRGKTRKSYWGLPSQGQSVQEEEPPLYAGAGVTPPPEDRDAPPAGFTELLEDEPLPFPAEGDDPFALAPPEDMDNAAM